MRKKGFWVTTLLVLALMLTACDEAPVTSTGTGKNSNSESSVTDTSKKQDSKEEAEYQKTEEDTVKTEKIEKEEDGEYAVDFTPAPTSTPTPTATSAPEKKVWKGEAPSLNDRWIGYYYSTKETTDGTEAFVLILEHNFSKSSGEGYFQAQYQYVYFENGVEELMSSNQMQYGSFDEAGGAGWFQDYTFCSGPDDMPDITKAAMYFHGDTVEFGFYDYDYTTITLSPLYLMDLSYY